MATKQTEYARAQVQRAPFAFEVKKIVRECVRPELGGSATIGELLDAQLLAVAMDGGEVQSITLHVDEDAWFKLAEDLRVTAQAKY